MLELAEDNKIYEELFPKQFGRSQQNEFKVLEEIGRGSFGSVRKVLHIPTSRLMVRKEIQYGNMNTKERQQLISECSILARLRHENIVEFYSWDHPASGRVNSNGTTFQGEVLYLYMEYCSCGDLSQMIKHYKNQRKYIKEKNVWRITVQILMALHKCHTSRDLPQLETIYDMCDEGSANSHLVIHRDLKPGNIFLTSSEEEAKEFGRGGNNVEYGKVYVKLGDFGLAKSLQSSIEFATTYVGTPYYMSPEVLMDQPYSPLSDIWSLGCVIYEMCALQVPFQAKNFMELQTKIKQGYVEPLPDHYSSELQDVIEACINVDQAMRPSAFELLQRIQLKIARKSLELEKFERHLLVYERELTKIGEMLEMQARDYDREINGRRLRYRKDFETAVDKRVKEFMSGKRYQEAPEFQDRYNVRMPINPWRSDRKM
ncbi:serine/threonine protein kinase KIN3 Ecym_5252 [Eremothecium cymbalariae DBVPG|uniref:non-specific serine/threonine protein kinase n=1 Tax=Eremothecium cymbalariae (strain CBS 270.75 / DBVPG 7215 / KCTC 17166 / NRRL Y-17582) TaxID=931890 RepID=I6ND76_ERECY|nr:hypothetical protein Ecym_5252 [Eremothecium cymbalariae DBVPG\